MLYCSILVCNNFAPFCNFQIVTVLLDSFRTDVCSPHAPAVASTAASSNGTGINVTKASLVGYEHVEFSTKSLLVLMRYRAAHMKVIASLWFG